MIVSGCYIYGENRDGSNPFLVIEERDVDNLIGSHEFKGEEAKELIEKMIERERK